MDGQRTWQTCDDQLRVRVAMHDRVIFKTYYEQADISFHDSIRVHWESPCEPWFMRCCITKLEACSLGTEAGTTTEPPPVTESR